MTALFWFCVGGAASALAIVIAAQIVITISKRRVRRAAAQARVQLDPALWRRGV